MSHIIFDLDGTLINSKQEIQKTYQKVFQQITSTQFSNLETINYHATLQKVLESAYGENPEKISAAKALFASYYDNSGFEETQLYDSVYETLQNLKQAGHHLYIATNKRRTPTLAILRIKKILEFFSAVMTWDTEGKNYRKEQMLAELKHQFDFEDGWMVGDAPDDILAGQAQQLKTIAVTYGNENKAVLINYSPSYLIDSFAQLAYLMTGI